MCCVVIYWGWVSRGWACEPLTYFVDSVQFSYYKISMSRMPNNLTQENNSLKSPDSTACRGLKPEGVTISSGTRIPYRYLAADLGKHVPAPPYGNRVSILCCSSVYFPLFYSPIFPLYRHLSILPLFSRYSLHTIYLWPECVRYTPYTCLYLPLLVTCGNFTYRWKQ